MNKGDTVILTRSNGRREVRTIVDDSGEILNVSFYKTPYNFRRDGKHVGGSADRIEPATAELVLQITAENERIAQEQRDEQARIAADPKTPLIARFNSGFEPWDKLTLEQLTQISTWLSSAS